MKGELKMINDIIFKDDWKWELRAEEKKKIKSFVGELLKKYEINDDIFDIIVGVIGVTLDTPTIYVTCYVYADAEISRDIQDRIIKEINEKYIDIEFCII
jgi:uncharacterized protein (UPF0297 family)